MPVPTSITDLSTTAASNSPAGTEAPSTLDNYQRAHAAFIAQIRAVIGGSTDPNIPSSWLTTELANVAKRSINGIATTISTATTLTTGDMGELFTVSANVLVTLPSSSSVTVGSVVAIRVTSAAGCTVNALSGNVAGVATLSLVNGELVELVANTVGGGGWLILTRQMVDAMPLAAKNNPAMGSFIGTQTKAQTVASGATNPVFPVNGCYIKNTATATSTWSFNIAFIDTSVAVVNWRVEITNGGAFAQTFSGVTWDGGSDPILQTSGVDTLDFWHDGTTLRGRHVNQAAFGVGQTWQDVTGSRAASTNYTNSTIRPICVSVTAQDPSGRVDPVLIIDGIQVANLSFSGTGNNRSSVSGIVPSGSVYSVTLGSNDVILLWAELR